MGGICPTGDATDADNQTMWRLNVILSLTTTHRDHKKERYYEERPVYLFRDNEVVSGLLLAGV